MFFRLVSALTNNRLMLPDLLTNPNTPPTEWRLVPLQYFGGGCDTLDVNPQDFVRQPNFCNSTYGMSMSSLKKSSCLSLISNNFEIGTCLNYGVSYWLKSNATLDQLFTNYNLLHGNFVDPTNQVKVGQVVFFLDSLMFDCSLTVLPSIRIVSEWREAISF